MKDLQIGYYSTFFYPVFPYNFDTLKEGFRFPKTC